MKKILYKIRKMVLLPLSLVRKIRLNSFAGGIVFGALFGLLVNIVTIKIQGDIDKQRILEALEREIMGHIMQANQVARETLELQESSDSVYLSGKLTMGNRLITRIWDEPEVSKYLLELNQETAGKVQLYYEVIVASTNELLQKNNEVYDELHLPCEPYYPVLMKKDRSGITECNEIVRDMTSLQTNIYQLIPENVTDITTVFHPTRDRLNSPWLKMLLGKEAPNILR